MHERVFSVRRRTRGGLAAGGSVAAASSGRSRPWTRLADRRFACRPSIVISSDCHSRRGLGPAVDSVYTCTHTHVRGAWGAPSPGAPHPPRAQGARRRRSLRPCVHAYLQTLFARFPAQVLDISMGRRYFLFIAGWWGTELWLWLLTAYLQPVHFEHQCVSVRVRGASGGCHARPRPMIRLRFSARQLTSTRPDMTLLSVPWHLPATPPLPPRDQQHARTFF